MLMDRLQQMVRPRNALHARKGRRGMHSQVLRYEGFVAPAAHVCHARCECGANDPGRKIYGVSKASLVERIIKAGYSVEKEAEHVAKMRAEAEARRKQVQNT